MRLSRLRWARRSAFFFTDRAKTRPSEKPFQIFGEFWPILSDRRLADPAKPLWTSPFSGKIRVFTFPVGTLISERPPGHRRRSPASGSHRTWRADFPHHALRRLVHSTARLCNARSLGRDNGVRSLIWLKASQVRWRPAQLRLHSILRQ